MQPQDIIGTATYSPEDNKLRLYPDSRLAPEIYARVKAHGFAWAPKQQLFVAPMWTPAREDLLIDLCGEIGDEDTSLVERAESRAERFEDYSEARKEDYERAHEAVRAITKHIPMGQPILVGHHSERRARKDAERIDSGMRRAIKMWEQASYWKSRAAGAIRAAKYKERPDVRARRIKGLESDKRAQERIIENAEKFTRIWSESLEWDPEIRRLTRERARQIANYDRACSGMCFPLKDYPRNPPASQYEGAMGLWSALGDSDEEAIITPEQARDFALRGHARAIASATRWLQHINNRLEYERAMLAESGGDNADKWDIQVGGRVLIGSEWLTVKRVNKSSGRVNSVTTNARYVPVRGIETISDYRAPEGDAAARVKAAMDVGPLCNYPGDGFVSMTKEAYERIGKHYRGFGKIRANDKTGAHRVREALGCFCGNDGSIRERHSYYGVYLTDAPRKNPPAATTDAPAIPPPSRVVASQPLPAPQPQPVEVSAMRETLRAGVQVVSAPQLFPTPPELAARMVELAGVQSGDTVLEPSAGTGNIARAVIEAVDTEVLAYEINPQLCAQMRRTLPDWKVKVQCRDFLTVTDFQGCYSFVLMNPPFENGSDIKHIRHALTMLKPGGRLVAICANGPRQREQLKPMASTWEDLPPGTFAGTGVHAALLTIEKGGAE